MNETLNSRFTILLKNFIHTISKEFKIKNDDVLKIASVSEKVNTKICMHRLTSGKNKGQNCKSKPMNNGYCSKHQKSDVAMKLDSLLQTKTREKIPKITATRQKLLDLMETAVSQRETVLHRTKDGLLNKETDILFDETFMVIGKMNGDAIVKLSEFDLEICERHGWKYSKDCIE